MMPRDVGQGQSLSQSLMGLKPQSAITPSDRPLRIALFTETFLPKIDGVVTRLTQSIRHLCRFGHHVLVIAPDGNLTEYEGARIHGVRGFSFPLYPDIRLAVPRPSIGQALAAFHPDLIHAVHPMFLGVSAFHYSAKLMVPLVISYHAQIDRYLQYYGFSFLESLLWKSTRAAYNAGDLVLCTSQAMVDLLRLHGIERVDLWQRGVDTELFHPGQAPAEMRSRLTNGHPESKLLLYVGRLSAEKCLEEARPLLQAIPDLRLALVGDGPHRANLEQYFAGTNTAFLGYLRGANLAAAYASADVFFMPSRTETLGLVVLEAMAAGCPPVAAAEGGIPDIVRDGVTGYLYPYGDHAAAISAARKLLHDPLHQAQMRVAARADAEHWSWAAATRQLENFYRGILAREEEVSHCISQHAAPEAAMDDICHTLRISKATFRRHARLLAARA